MRAGGRGSRKFEDDGGLMGGTRETGRLEDEFGRQGRRDVLGWSGAGVRR